MTGYFIEDVSNSGKYWAGQASFGELGLETQNYTPPSNAGHGNIIYSGIVYNPPVKPFKFNTEQDALDALQDVPRKFNVRVVKVDTTFQSTVCSQQNYPTGGFVPGIIEAKRCTCSIDDLMIRGCKCGC